MPRMKIKILASHPVQYHVPFIRTLVDAGVEVEVLYYYQGAAGKVEFDPGFGIDMEWDLDLLSGYPYSICLKGTPDYSLWEQIRVLPGLLAWSLKDRSVPLLFMGWFVEVVWLIWLLRILVHLPVMAFSETTPQSFANRPKPVWRSYLLGWLLRHTQAVMFIGQRNRLFYEDMGVSPNRLFFTPYSVDNEYFAEESERISLRKRGLRKAHGLDPDLPVFQFSGKLIPKKRPLELLEAYLAAGLQDHAQLFYVGEGILRAEIEQRAADAGANHVRCSGFLNQSQMPMAYALGDLLCLLSDADETWGLVVNEALACGLPVIVSNAAGCSPDLVSEENGWVVCLDDKEQLVRTLRDAYNRRDDWLRMGAAGERKVAEYNYAKMTSGICSALQFISMNPSWTK